MLFIINSSSSCSKYAHSSLIHPLLEGNAVANNVITLQQSLKGTEVAESVQCLPSHTPYVFSSFTRLLLILVYYKTEVLRNIKFKWGREVYWIILAKWPWIKTTFLTLLQQWLGFEVNLTASSLEMILANLPGPTQNQSSYSCSWRPAQNMKPKNYSFPVSKCHWGLPPSDHTYNLYQQLKISAALGDKMFSCSFCPNLFQWWGDKQQMKSLLWKLELPSPPTAYWTSHLLPRQTKDGPPPYMAYVC